MTEALVVVESAKLDGFCLPDRSTVPQLVHTVLAIVVTAVLSGMPNSAGNWIEIDHHKQGDRCSFRYILNMHAKYSREVNYNRQLLHRFQPQ